MKLKTLKLLILFFLAASVARCSDETTELLSDEQISSNLLLMGDDDGSVDPALLIGEWNIVKFAYTADGNKISNITDITVDSRYDIELIASHNGISIDEAIDIVRPKLLIPAYNIEWIASQRGISIDEVTEELLNQFGKETSMNDIWGLSAGNSSSWICSLSGNLINLTCCFSTTVRPTDLGEVIIDAFSNAYSFVIKGDELIIYFAGDKKKNLLISKKR